MTQGWLVDRRVVSDRSVVIGLKPSTIDGDSGIVTLSSTM